jgi:hypothetical protein
MSNVLTILAAALVAIGWVGGASLVAVAALAEKAPRGWALRELAPGRTRRLMLVAGLALLVGSTILLQIVDYLLTPEF